MAIERFMLRRLLAFVGIMLFYSVSPVRAQLQVPVSCKAPLTEEQLTRLLVSGVADVRVQVIVSQCGVTFEPTTGSDNRLRRAGASSALLKIAHSASPRARRAAQLRAEIRPAVSQGGWAEAEAKMAELKALVPEDDEIRAWAAAIDEHERVERKKREEAAEQKHREELRLAELRQKAGIESSVIEDLKPNLTLDDARQKLVWLRAQIRDIEAHLKKEYPDLETSPHLTKDTFETTAEYEARLAKATAMHEELERAFKNDLNALTESNNRQIADLLSRKYSKPGLMVSLTNYDADHQLLFATAENYSYWFNVEPQRAQLLYARQSALEVKGNFLRAEESGRSAADEIAMNVPQTQQELKSAGAATRIDGKWQATLDERVEVSRKAKRTEEALAFDLSSTNIIAEDREEITGTSSFGTVLGSVLVDEVFLVDYRTYFLGRVEGDQITLKRYMCPTEGLENHYSREAAQRFWLSRRRSLTAQSAHNLLVGDLTLVRRTTSDKTDINSANRPSKKSRDAALKHGLFIETAFYGFSNHRVNVTNQLRSAVKDGSLHFNAGNEIAGDPAPGIPKELTVTYTLAKGDSVLTKVVSEGETLDLP